MSNHLMHRKTDNSIILFIQSGNMIAVKILLENGADPNVYNRRYDDSALQKAFKRSMFKWYSKKFTDTVEHFVCHKNPVGISVT